MRCPHKAYGSPCGGVDSKRGEASNERQGQIIASENPVPFILVNYDSAYTLREGGCLADVAPTLLEMMGLEKPEEMTGESLLVRKPGM